jgi:hypothetical protein
MASILKVDTIQDQSGNNIITIGMTNADTITIGQFQHQIILHKGIQKILIQMVHLIQAHIYSNQL